MILPKKMFGQYEVDFPIEDKLIVVIGPNGSGKTQALYLLKDYFKSNNKNVVYFSDYRMLDVTIKDVNKALEKLESLAIMHKLAFGNDNLNLFKKYGFDKLGFDRLEFDLNCQYQNYISSGFIQLINFFTKIINAGPNAIVIIDTPETSLHISVRRTFLNDIMGLGNVDKLIIATHSPEIILDHSKVIDISKCVKFI